MRGILSVGLTCEIWIFKRFCMTQAVRSRNFCFWLVRERHFAEEFGDLEWQEMPGIQFALVEGLGTFF